VDGLARNLNKQLNIWPRTQAHWHRPTESGWQWQPGKPAHFSPALFTAPLVAAASPPGFHPPRLHDDASDRRKHAAHTTHSENAPYSPMPQARLARSRERLQFPCRGARRSNIKGTPCLRPPAGCGRGGVLWFSSSGRELAPRRFAPPTNSSPAGGVRPTAARGGRYLVYGSVGFMPLQFLEIGFHVEIHVIECHDFQRETQFHGVVVA